MQMTIYEYYNTVYTRKLQRMPRALNLSIVPMCRRVYVGRHNRQLSEGSVLRPVERKERTRRASERSIYWHDCVGRRKHVSSRGTVGEVKEEGDRVEYTRKGEKQDSNREEFHCVGYLHIVPVHNCSYTALNLTYTRRVTHAFPLLLICFADYISLSFSRTFLFRGK